MDDTRIPFVGLVTLTCVAGAVTMALVALHTPVAALIQHAHLSALLVVLILLGELRPIVIARGDSVDEVTISSTFTLALTILGPLELALLAQTLSVSVEDVRSRKSPIKIAFNASQYVLTIITARAAFCLLGDAPFLGVSPFDVPGDIPAALAAGGVFFLVNNGLAGMVTALAMGLRVLPHLRADVQFQLATSGVLLSFAPVVVLTLSVSAWMAPLLLLPILAIHRSARLAADREYEAMHDILTGLPNRALFRLRAAHDLAELGRGDRHVVVMLVDLDHFKDINDTLGHHVGDELIVLVGKRLRSGIRPEDTVCRLGGDEFAVLATVSDVGDAKDVATRLMEGLRDTFEVDGVRLDVQASIGIAIAPEHGTDVDTLVQRADIALYDAKVDRGRASVYEASADVHSVERLTLAGELRIAVESDPSQLFLVYQPQLSSASGQTVGLEALVRWQHPKHGVIYPDEFLPVTENTGLVIPLTMTVLEQALTAVRRWRDADYDLHVAVNLSARHLSDRGLASAVKEVLDRHGLPGEALVLEVTETVIMADPTRAAVVLRQLRRLGVRLAVDDFGTGYSSLSHLRKLEVDELKIDKSFVMSLSSSTGDSVIVRSTIEMAHNLGLTVTAEGVEDQETAQLLRAWGCEQLQGYLISRPLDECAVTRWLDSYDAALSATPDHTPHDHTPHDHPTLAPGADVAADPAVLRSTPAC